MDQNLSSSDSGNEEHPFTKVLAQINDLLDILEKNKNKPVSDAPAYVIDELEHVLQEFERFKKVVSMTVPLSDFDEKSFRKLVRSLPPEARPPEAEVVEAARLLKARAETLERDFTVPSEPTIKPETKKTEPEPEIVTPMSLLSKDEETPEKKEKEMRDTLEHKKKFNRVGGKKNWRPL